MTLHQDEVVWSRLSRLVREQRRVHVAREQQSNEEPRADRGTAERCDLCGGSVTAEHRHLVDVASRRLVCACSACATVFHDGSSGKLQFRLIPKEVRQPPDFDLSDAMWAELGIPVDMAFFFLDTAAARIVALYPSALGVTESRLSLAAWDAIVQRNPVLSRLAPDVEALLVNRTRGAREQWLVPIDVCYQLAGLIRRHWKGLGGGEEVWRQLAMFFEQLRQRSRQRLTISASSTAVTDEEHTS